MLVPLSDAMALPDEFLFTAIGSKTQDPYKNLIAWTKEHNPLNKYKVLQNTPYKLCIIQEIGKFQKAR